MKKIALVSHSIPPHWSGQAIMIGRLFWTLNPKKYIVICSRSKKEIYSNDISKPLKAKHVFLDTKFSKVDTSRFHARLIARFLPRLLAYYVFAMNFLFDLNQRSRKIMEILKEERIQLCIACSGDPLDIPAAASASEKLNVAFYPYFFDFFSQPWPKSTYRKIAGKIEKKIIKKSKKIIVPNEELLKEYKKLYNVDGVVLHNPVDLDRYKGIRGPKISPKSRVNISHFGAIYGAQFDSVLNLIKAIDLLKHKFNIRFQAYCTCDLDSKMEKKIVPYRKIIDFKKPKNEKEIPSLQKKSHILFLPLAFQSDYTDLLINTSAPGKMGEYLATGQPILVHAPRKSYISKYFKKYQCGKVVDTDSYRILAKEIASLIEDPKRQRTYQKNAINRAKIDFDLENISKKFKALFN